MAVVSCIVRLVIASTTATLRLHLFKFMLLAIAVEVELTLQGISLWSILSRLFLIATEVILFTNLRDLTLPLQ